MIPLRLYHDRITWLSITIVHRHVVYGETQLCTEVNGNRAWIL